MPENNETKIQTETTRTSRAAEETSADVSSKGQSEETTKAPEGSRDRSPVTVEEAVKIKEVEAPLGAKFIPTSYKKQEIGDAKEQEDGTVVRFVKLSEPLVPHGVEIDPLYEKQTQVIIYRDSKRIGCKILDAEDKEIAELNTAMLDG